jgi:hypothetical protein
LHDDSAAVRTTKWISPAAVLIPISENTITNGLWLGFRWFHATSDMMTTSAPT